MVEDGRINLTGEVDWAYQRFSAEHALRYLFGVKGISNLITIKPRIAPADIEQKIEAALQRQAQREARNIKLSINNGNVTLNGTVHSMAERRAAEGAVWGAPGVTSVTDNLVIN